MISNDDIPIFKGSSAIVEKFSFLPVDSKLEVLLLFGDRSFSSSLKFDIPLGCLEAGYYVLGPPSYS